MGWRNRTAIVPRRLRGRRPPPAGIVGVLPGVIYIHSQDMLLDTNHRLFLPQIRRHFRIEIVSGQSRRAETAHGLGYMLNNPGQSHEI